MKVLKVIGIIILGMISLVIIDITAILTGPTQTLICLLSIVGLVTLFLFIKSRLFEEDKPKRYYHSDRERSWRKEQLSNESHSSARYIGRYW